MVPFCLNILEVKPAKRKRKSIGVGVFATEPIKSGTTVCISPIILLKDAKGVEDYYFLHEGNMLLALGVGSLMNHSSKPNVDYNVTLKSIKFVAVADISAGEELLIDYGTSYWYNRNTDVPE